VLASAPGAPPGLIFFVPGLRARRDYRPERGTMYNLPERMMQAHNRRWLMSRHKLKPGNA